MRPYAANICRTCGRQGQSIASKVQPGARLCRNCWNSEYYVLHKQEINAYRKTATYRAYNRLKMQKYRARKKEAQS